MRDGFIKVACCTPKIKVADPQYNVEAIISMMREAGERKAKLILFPELCLTGYTCHDLFGQELMLTESLRGLEAIASATADIDALVVVGLPIERDGCLYNVAAVLNHGDILGMVPKTFLPTYGEFYDSRHFVPGNKKVTGFDLDFETIPFGTDLLFKCREMPELVVACEVCEDLWVADTPGTAHALAGATVIMNPSASNETVCKDEYRRMLLQSTSGRLLCAYMYASAGDGESTQDLVFGGHNMVAENGSILAESERFKNGIITTDLDLRRLRTERRRIGEFRCPEGRDYVEVGFNLEIEETELVRTFNPAPFVPSDMELRRKRCDEILNIQAYGLKKRYEHTGLKSAVIGVSGGLDSTLALLVIARTFDLLGLDRSGIVAVTMPCFGTTDRTYNNACKLARVLGATLREINIKEAVEVHFRDIAHDPEKHDVTYENGQARERTQILMDVANQTCGLVIGTGDMSELALGWATYNGDHMSMYGVNVGVPKTLVRHLVDYYAETCGDEELTAVLKDVLDTPVSPELLPPTDGKISQKTEELVGPYELHDFFLYYVLRWGYAPGKIYRIAKLTFDGRYDKETILKWLKTFYRRFFSQQFKRSCLPDGPKVGSVAVSPRGDLRMPSDASANIWMRELENLQ